MMPKNRTLVFLNTFLFNFFFTSPAQAQTNITQGRIVYLSSNNSGVKFYGMVFNNFEYRYTEVKDINDCDRSINTDSVIKAIEENNNLTLSEKMREVNKNAQPPIIYGNLATTQTLTSYFNTEKTKICISDTIPQLINWQLLNQTDTIEGIICGVARGTVGLDLSFLGYYAKEIPVSVAPFQMRGLPGLLIKIVNEKKPSNVMVVARLEWPLKSSNLFINKCAECKTITKQEYNKRENAKQQKILAAKKRFDAGEKVTIDELF